MKLLYFIAVLVSVSALAKSTKIEGSISVKGKAESEFSTLAKITLQEATKIATKLVPGTVIEAALEKEDGFLVYEVEILEANRNKKEILIDAGNGKVLEVKD